MSNSSVVVHDIQELESFREFLQKKREDAEALFNEIETRSDKQGDNWQDPQYKAFMCDIDEYLKSSRQELDVFDKAIAYVTDKLYKIRNL